MNVKKLFWCIEGSWPKLFQFPFSLCGIQSGISQMERECYATVVSWTTNGTLLWNTLYSVNAVHNTVVKSVNFGVRLCFNSETVIT